MIILIDSGREVFHKAGHRLRYLARQGGPARCPERSTLFSLPGGRYVTCERSIFTIFSVFVAYSCTAERFVFISISLDRYVYSL